MGKIFFYIRYEKKICQSNLEMSSSGNLEMSGLVGCYPQVHSSLSALNSKRDLELWTLWVKRCLDLNSLQVSVIKKMNKLSLKRFWSERDDLCAILFKISDFGIRPEPWCKNLDVNREGESY